MIKYKELRVSIESQLSPDRSRWLPLSNLLPLEYSSYCRFWNQDSSRCSRRRSRHCSQCNWNLFHCILWVPFHCLEYDLIGSFFLLSLWRQHWLLGVLLIKEVLQTVAQHALSRSQRSSLLILRLLLLPPLCRSECILPGWLFPHERRSLFRELKLSDMEDGLWLEMVWRRWRCFLSPWSALHLGSKMSLVGEDESIVFLENMPDVSVRAHSL